jgi:hypothetical protein
MKALMARGPIVAVGGTSDTLALLPRLGFKDVARAHHLVLPLTLAGLPARLAALPVDRLTRLWGLLSAYSAPGLQPVQALGARDEVAAEARRYDLVQIPNQEVYDWLSSCSKLGE